MPPSSTAVGWDADLGILTPSAIRGDVSYMLYSFHWSILGLAISFGLIVALDWCRFSGFNDPILHPHFWAGVIALIAVSGGMSLAGAFIFLELCIQKMNHYTSSTTQALSLDPVAYLGYAVRLSFSFAHVGVWLTSNSGYRHADGCALSNFHLFRTKQTTK